MFSDNVTVRHQAAKKNCEETTERFSNIFGHV